MRFTKTLSATGAVLAAALALVPAGAFAQPIPDHWIVVVKPGQNPVTVAARNGVTPTFAFDAALNGFAARIPAARLAQLRADAAVDFIEPDLAAQAFAQALPSGVDRMDADLSPIAAIDGIDARVDVDVAIIDTGIDLTHPDLNVFRGVSFVKGNRTGNDDNGHGSHCAGSAAALDNGAGVVGVAPGARLWAVKVLDRNGSGQISTVIKGIDYVAQNAASIEVASLSLGARGVSTSLHNAIKNCVAKGVVVVVAAGNEARDVYGPDGIFPSADDTIPAAYPEAAAVSAMGDTDGRAGGLGPNTSRGGRDDDFADFSNYGGSVVAGNPVTSSGASIDVCAPGVDIYSTYKGGGYAMMSGTSMATPHVAGLAALRASAGRPTSAAGVAALRQAIIDSAEAQSSWRTDGTLPGDRDSNREGLAKAN